MSVKVPPLSGYAALLVPRNFSAPVTTQEVHKSLERAVVSVVAIDGTTKHGASGIVLTVNQRVYYQKETTS